MAVLLRHTLTLLIFQKSTQALALCCSNALLLQGLSVTDATQCINVMSAICTNAAILLGRRQLNKLNILQITKNKNRMEVEQATSQWNGAVASHIVL